ncbi:cell division protein FtsX [Pseudooceanicola sp. C21-150M6]|uniref:cell division protein FtsX n=1 Tax=Pseudooceanicola sp. C21-150M6 TaxID=3434355 RepID=UPI003D7F7BA8
MRLRTFLSGEGSADRVVPPSEGTAYLTLFVAGVMTFLVVFALALSLATGRLAQKWDQELAHASTIRISAPQDQLAAQTETVLNVLRTTEGVASARALTTEDQRALLAPWFGENVPVAALPVPQLVEVIETRDGYDAAGLRLRLSAEAPGAVLDDHGRWRRPLVTAANRLRWLGYLCILLIGGAMAALITLAANAALAANAQVIEVMRLVGAQDRYIAQAFVRRFTLRTLAGAIIGMALGMFAILILPAAQDQGGFLTGLGFRGGHWLLPLLLPFIAAGVAYLATRRAALRVLGALS